MGNRIREAIGCCLGAGLLICHALFLGGCGGLKVVERHLSAADIAATDKDKMRAPEAIKVFNESWDFYMRRQVRPRSDGATVSGSIVASARGFHRKYSLKNSAPNASITEINEEYYVPWEKVTSVEVKETRLGQGRQETAVHTFLLNFSLRLNNEPSERSLQIPLFYHPQAGRWPYSAPTLLKAYSVLVGPGKMYEPAPAQKKFSATRNIPPVMWDGSN